jgi:acyl-CoA ligase (AMP-forming) (exosortase A-associated)
VNAVVRSRIHELIADVASVSPESSALTFRKDTVTYGDLWSQVLAVGSALIGLGLERGDRVAVYLDKRPETVTAVFGTAAAGGVFVPVNPVFKPRQVGYILRDCTARVLVTTSERLALLEEELSAAPSVRQVLLVGQEQPARSGAGPRTHPWPRDGIDTRTDAGRAVPVGGPDSDVAAILYTSGSTGGPKGVVLSHRNLIVGAESVSSYLRNSADDVILSVLPLSFDAGFSQLTTAFAVGAHVVLLNYLLAKDVVRACARHQVTGLTCVPPLWLQLVDQDWPPEAAENLRYFANTGGRMPRATLARLRALFPQASPFLMYGLTEAFRSTYLDPEQIDHRPDSIGKAIPNAEILVVRPDGTPCDPGEEGELVHRGPLVSLGYWNDPERTAERFRPAPGTPAQVCLPETAVWSGDSVTRDQEGFLYFVGRQDDMIKTSGYRVSPTEIEEAAYDTGLVTDAVALGVDDPELGQRVVLVVSPPAGGELDTEDLLGVLRGSLPLFMVPRRIEVRPEIPRSPNGKFDRNALRQETAR